LDVVV